jgi:hypothetical protein
LKPLALLSWWRSEMPNIVLTDEELQEVDRLLTEFDPESHPETASTLKILSEDARVTLVTWVRESQRTALDLAIPMRALTDSAESTGLMAHTRAITRPGDNIEDGWMALVNGAYESHPLAEKAGAILNSLDEDAYLRFTNVCFKPADDFSRVEELYESPAKASA